MNTIKLIKKRLSILSVKDSLQPTNRALCRCGFETRLPETEADWKTNVQVYYQRTPGNVKLKLKPSKEPLLIVTLSSHTCTKPHVVGSLVRLFIINRACHFWNISSYCFLAFVLVIFRVRQQNHCLQSSYHF